MSLPSPLQRRALALPPCAHFGTGHSWVSPEGSSTAPPPSRPPPITPGLFPPAPPGVLSRRRDDSGGNQAVFPPAARAFWGDCGEDRDSPHQDGRPAAADDRQRHGAAAGPGTAQSRPRRLQPGCDRRRQGARPGLLRDRPSCRSPPLPLRKEELAGKPWEGQTSSSLLIKKYEVGLLKREGRFVTSLRRQPRKGRA